MGLVAVRSHGRYGFAEVGAHSRINASKNLVVVTAIDCASNMSWRSHQPHCRSSAKGFQGNERVVVHVEECSLLADLGWDRCHYLGDEATALGLAELTCLQEFDRFLVRLPRVKHRGLAHAAGRGKEQAPCALYESNALVER